MAIFRRLRGGAESLLGGLGRGILRKAQQVGQTISDAYSRFTQAGVRPEPLTVAREWGQVRLEGEREPTFASIGTTEIIPRSLYTRRETLYGKPYQYTVAIYGRDRATGRFANPRLDMWSSRELTPEEAIEEAFESIGTEGTSAKYDIESISLVGASIRSTAHWR